MVFRVFAAEALARCMHLGRAECPSNVGLFDKWPFKERCDGVLAQATNAECPDKRGREQIVRRSFAALHHYLHGGHARGKGDPGARSTFVKIYVEPDGARCVLYRYNGNAYDATFEERLR